MNCTQSHDLLQQRLDRVPLADRAALDRHLADCSECRQLHAAAARLEDGLRLLVPPLPPEGLATTIAARVMADRRRRLLTVRLPAMVGLAATVLLAFLIGNHRSDAPGDSWVMDQARRAWNSVFGPPATSRPTFTIVSGASPVIPVEYERSAEPPPSLRASVVEAGSAVVSLSRRAADETVGQTRLLLPEAIPAPPLTTAEPVIEPPAESLRQAGQGMTAALDPVTSSARRAVSLFWREASAVAPE